MRRATIRTAHGDEETARAIARAIDPDNTDEMRTQARDETVETTIERATTGSLQATVDDYVVNLTVAARLANDNTTHDT